MRREGAKIAKTDAKKCKKPQMVEEFAQFSKVQIIRLDRALEDYDGWRMNRRPPAVGDIGYVLDILRSGSQLSYVVESSRPDGITEWIGDFSRDELQLTDADT